MERLLRIERQRLGSEAAEAKAWHESPFTRSSVVVGAPVGAFARLVTEIKPVVPRRMWRKALAGRSPDGRIRLVWTFGRAEDGDAGAGSAVLRRRRQQASRCSVFMVYDYEALDAGLRLVVLADGRAAFCGELSDLRRVAIQTIASKEMPAESLLDMTYTDRTWRFE